MNWREMLAGLRNAGPATLMIDYAGNRPQWMNVTVTAAVLLLVLGIGGWWFPGGSLKRLESAENREMELRHAYERKSAQAAYLPAYRDRQQRLASEHASLVSLLPRDSEIPDLLEAITRAAADSGLVVRSVELQPEQREDFYVALPMSISVEGGYHEIGTFVNRLAGLRRLVTLHDFDLAAVGQGGALGMNLLARTYARPPGKDDAQ